MALHGLPTDEGISILQSDQRQYCKKAYFMMHTDSSAVFDTNPSKTLEEYFSDWEAQGGEKWAKDVYQAYFDDEGKLVFEILLKRSEDPPTTGKWIRGLILVYVDPETSEETSVAVSTFPEIEKVVGISLDVVLKLDITGEENEIVFADGECATRSYVDSKFEEVWETLESYGISEGEDTGDDDKKLVTFEDLFYYFLLENSNFQKLYYDRLLSEDALEIVSGSATYDSSKTAYQVEDTPCIFETGNVIEEGFSYSNFLIHVEADGSVEVSYSIDGGNTWVNCEVDKTVNVAEASGQTFSDLRFRISINTSNAYFYSFGVLYDKIDERFVIDSIEWSEDPPHYWSNSYDVEIKAINFRASEGVTLSYDVEAYPESVGIQIEQDENQPNLFHITYPENTGESTITYHFIVCDSEGYCKTKIQNVNVNVIEEYTKEITIEERSGNDLTDYQVLVKLNSFNFDFSKSQPDGSDIYFTDNEGNQIPFWIEEWDSDNQKAKVWVKVPFIPANGTTTIYLNYGGVPKNLSNGDDTFEFFDDASNDSKMSRYQYVDVWSPGETASLNYNSNNCEYIMQHTSTDNEFLKILDVSIVNCCLRGKFKFTSLKDNNQFGFYLAHSGQERPNDKGYLLRIEEHIKKLNIHRMDGGENQTKIGGVSFTEEIQENVYYDFETFYFNGNLKAILRRLDGSEIISAEGNDSTYSYDKVGIMFAWDAEVKVAFKDIILRKYVDPEPVVFVGGAAPVGDTGVFGGGNANGVYNTIDYVIISNDGTNAQHFGVLTEQRNSLAATSNGINDRGIFGGGYHGSCKNIIDYITISNVGADAEDFGDLYEGRYGLTATSNGTKDRGIFAAGYNGSVVFNIIDYVTISSPGNSQDFGDLTITNYAPAATSNSNAEDDRGVIGGGGHSGNYFNNIDWITISTLCNAQLFGELTVARRLLAATSNGINNRGVFGGGKDSHYFTVDTIDYITISTIGDAQPFGELQRDMDSLAATSNGVNDRGIFGGGWNPNDGYLSSIDYITISNEGTNAQPFGELTEERNAPAATSNA